MTRKGESTGRFEQAQRRTRGRARERAATGARTGAAAAVVWAAADPLARRLLRCRYSDVRFLQRTVVRSTLLAAGVHTAIGAVFGAGFAALGGRGWRTGVAAAEAEALAAWPLMVALDRRASRRLSRTRLTAKPCALAQSLALRALFGALVGFELERRA
jgi:hypothetical protein